MRQILLNAQGAVVARMPCPVVEPGCVLVRVHYSLVSVGTELAALRPASASSNGSATASQAQRFTRFVHQYLGKAFRDPRKAVRRIASIARQAILDVLPARPSVNGSVIAESVNELDQQGWNVGYSAAGEVLAVGDGIRDLAPGDWVACGGAGQANHADYVRVKRNLVCRVPKDCSLQSAATTTVGAIALQGVRRAAPQLGERIAVLGLGLIGQLTAQLLRANGCTVLGMDLDPQRVARARKLGTTCGASNPEEFKQLVRDVTSGWGTDRTIITAATRSDAVINLAMDVTRSKGTVVIVGDVGMNVQRTQFYRKEIDLLMSTSYGPGRYDRTYEEEGRDYPFAYVRWTTNRNMQAYLELIAAGKLDVEALIDQVVSVDQAPAVYQKLAQATGHVPLGVLLHYREEHGPDAEAANGARITLRGHQRERREVIRYALVGAGAFGTCMLVPQMQKRPERFFLRGLVSRDSARGGNFARSNRLEVLTTDLQTILDDPGFDLVVIATRHHEHAAQVMASLKAGKHVFVEKPLALSWHELHDITELHAGLAKKPLLMVGFNRRFSPAVRIVKDMVSPRRAPLIVNYRLNGGYIPLDSWMQGPEGGGRNLGEACHMYDVFRHLADAPVTRISAHAINPGALPYLRNDNFCASLVYQDGSVANLVYTALGPKQGLGKERIEVFCDGEAFVIDDFKSVVRASDSKVLWQSAEPDKGHFEELSRFGDALAAGAEAPIPFEEIVETTAVALQVEDLIHERVVDDAA